ncbi:MAG TPA: asparagine synthase (glutamine-hydrolyzing) [Methylomusa anaerophila]|uniref:asparagine synthase (glutamine-hydrolyzing) n=1 Tax=Methylomusa anaerophila TaxID=1930071 RepID=A0A348ALZ9_9FIRM|nr:asparagine synthase (glutamine-hydrolyzing) [Methylomusa anaerophila]BBB92097.1 asparagine synthetase [glutamine-hydrolyzing] 3 [Methylomusa anaerophila]HML87889.1 asparagine synthase (glutamine-hydrolyzing) [Methylomusa anaerophila]
MCGIAGWVDWERDLSKQEAVIDKMINTIRHRGPDAGGKWLSQRAALGHRRLIVIDPAGGVQPMIAEENGHKYVLTYNGEIYNFRELRKELESRGHKFRSQCDTEVLLRAYLEWGNSCVNHLNGIFAFGLWDSKKEQLLLARDHLGVKPLFYAERGSGVIFGSELKALLANPLVKPEVDATGLLAALNFLPLHIPGSSVFRNVFEVRPGHRLVFDHNGRHDTQYWSLKSAPHTDDLKTTTERIQALLKDTVGRQLVADVPVVTLLSGGLDSSGITALAAKEFAREGKKLNTYSVEFEESSRYFLKSEVHESLDAPYIQSVSEHVDTQHHEIMVDSAQLLDNLLVPMRARDYPAYGQGETSMYLLFKAMKSDATVALSGESADEVFGGYKWFFSEDLVHLTTFPWIALLARGSLRVEEILPWYSPDLLEIIRPGEYLNARYREAVNEVPGLEGESILDAKRREGFYLNLTRFLPILLDRKDRMSMAVGFEVRVPFCDYRLVEYVWNIPWEMKSVGNMEKGILRRAFANVLPTDVVNRRKSGYPVSHHPAYVKGIRELFQTILNDPAAPIRPLLNIQAVEKSLNNMSQHEHAFNETPLERLIMANAWLKEYHVSLPAGQMQMT